MAIEIRALLQKARKTFDEGRQVEAILMIDHGIKRYAGTDYTAELVRQHDSWASARESLIADFLERAEKALRKEDPDTAYRWYAKILELKHDHKVATGRIRKIEMLRKIEKRP